MSRTSHTRTLFLLIIGVAIAGCSGPSDLEVAEEFTSAFVAGDVDAMAALSTDVSRLGAIPWRSEFNDALELQVESSACAKVETRTVCTVSGPDLGTSLLAPGYSAERVINLVIEDGVVQHGWYETGGDPMPRFDEYLRWTMANRADLFDGPCADIDGASDPTTCALAVVDAAERYAGAQRARAIIEADRLAFAPDSEPFAGLVTDAARAAIQRSLSDTTDAFDLVTVDDASGSRG